MGQTVFFFLFYKQFIFIRNFKEVSGWLVVGLFDVTLDPKIKCFHQTRLETRTKESNIYASRRVENLEA